MSTTGALVSPGTSAGHAAAASTGPVPSSLLHPAVYISLPPAPKAKQPTFYLVERLQVDSGWQAGWRLTRSEWKRQEFKRWVSYEVSVQQTGGWACTCTSFARHAPGFHCKHVLALRKLRKAGVIG